MQDLVWSMLGLIKENHCSSYASQGSRYDRLKQAANVLAIKNPKLTDVKNIKTKHIDQLIQGWLDKGLKAGTIKNRVADLRWLARKINKQNIVKRENADYGIPDRVYVDNDTNRAKDLTQDDLARLTDPYTRYALRLQQAFGLRREEAIKFRVHQADQGTHIHLAASWCKGGRPRKVPIRNAEQRALLTEIKVFCEEKDTPSLIPKERSYYQQRTSYQYQTKRYQVTWNHGLRHAYAQTRYTELTKGKISPKQGGDSKRELTQEQRQLDYEARMVISDELGHGREGITTAYLGR